MPLAPRAPGDSPDPDQFFITGGTLPTRAPSYIVRQADTELYEGLRAGEFCYVLNTRQMGKSSLMVRTAARLRKEAGAIVCLLDLTAVGLNVTPAQWYFGLLTQVASQLDQTGEREAAAEEFWQASADLGPMQRFFAAFEKVFLPTLPAPSPRLVVFVDEVDAARSLPFPADEFFAGIRECYNRRAANPLYDRLTFCLLGVATPADLISDARMSPFNIGRRIRLEDFTEAEATPLAVHLPGGMATLRRSLYWTGGHPYLTQCLLYALATGDGGLPPGDAGVDAVCQRLFLTRDAREIDDNLTFVRNRLLHSGGDLAALLDLYRRIREPLLSESPIPPRWWKSRRIRDDETNPRCVALRLAGVVKPDAGGFLIVRNRIYDRVFDREWVDAHLPDAERQRQRAAFQRGVLRATALGAAGVLAFGVLAGVAVVQAYEARRQTRLALERLSQRYADEGIRLLTEGDPLAAVDALTEALRLDERSLPERVASARRRLAYARRQVPQAAYETPCGSPILWAEPSPDGRRFVTATEAGVARIWDAATGQPLTPEMRHEKAIRHAAFSPDGSRIATASEDGTGRIWDARTGGPLTPPLRYHFSRIALHADWSRDGRTLAISGGVGAALWDAATGREQSRIWDTDTGGPWDAHGESRMETRAVAFAPDGKRVAFAANPYRANFADPVTGKMNGLVGHTHSASQVVYSPDGTRIALAGLFDPNQQGGGSGGGLCEGATGKAIALLPHRDYGTDAWFSPDGRRVATGSRDGTARVWDSETGKPVTPPLPHNASVQTVRFSADGRRLVTACQDGTAQIWEIRTGLPVGPPLRHPAPLRAAFLAPDGRHVLTACTDGTARYWEPPASDGEGRRVGFLPAEPGTTPLARISRGARRVFFRHEEPGDTNRRYAAFDAATGRTLFSLPDPDAPGSELPYPNGIILNGDGSLLALEHRAGVSVWNLEQGRYQFTVNVPGPVTDLLFATDPQGEHLRLRLPDLKYQAFDAQTGRPRSAPFAAPTQFWSTFDGQLRQYPYGIHADHAWFSPDGRYVYVIPSTGSVGGPLKAGDNLLWDVAANTVLPLTFDWKEIYFQSFSPQSRFLLLCTDRVSLWNLETRTCQELPLKRGTRILSVAFSPDERLLATGSDDGAARLWDTATGQTVLPPLPHRGTVLSLAFSREGYLATASSDGAIGVWDTRTGERLTPPLHLSESPQQVAFTEDGRSLIAAGGTEARRWNVGP